MSLEREPARLIDDPATSDLLRDALSSASLDEPTAAEIAAAGTAAAVRATSTGVATKVVIGIAALLIGGGGGLLLARRAGHAVAVPVVATAAVTESASAPTAPIESAPVPAASAPPPPAATSVAAAPTQKLAPRSETAILTEAQTALRDGNANAALAAATEHQKHYPNGTFGPEREVIAIDALLRLGRRDAAEVRAASFRARWPGSSHLRRVEKLLAR